MALRCSIGIFLGAIAIAGALLAAPSASAQDLKLIANCSSPQGTAAPLPPPVPLPPQPPKDGSGSTQASPPPPPPPPTPTTTSVSCELRATDYVAFKSVKANIKDRSDQLEVTWDPFDPRTKSLAGLFLIQTTDPIRPATLRAITRDVIDMTQARDGKRKFAAYSYANDLNKLAEFSASSADFERAVSSLKPLATTTQLYKTALDAISVLAKEPADRKALVILGDGTTNDQNYKAEDVVKAARDAGIVIHVLGYFDESTRRPDFQNFSRLARDTGGFQAELKPRAKSLPTDATTSRFIGEVLENGGTAKITLKEPSGGNATVNIAADFTNGRFASAEQVVNIPAPPQPLSPPVSISDQPKPSKPEGFFQGILSWVQRNAIVSFAIGAALGLGIIGAILALTSAAKQPKELTDAQGRPVVYGWLEMLDGNASRYPLRTTNVRIGRHQDNDVCLRNDSISRRHAVLHFNSENRRFVITDLGGGNGVIVNKSKYTSRELNDGDMVELGEVRLRFRANMELMG